MGSASGLTPARGASPSCGWPPVVAARDSARRSGRAGVSPSTQEADLRIGVEAERAVGVVLGQFDRRSPSFINLGCYRTCAGSTAAFDALTCENAGRARWWGGVTPMGASGRRTTTMKFLVTAGCPGGQRPVRPGLRGVSAPSPALVAVTAVWMGPTRSWRPRGAYPRTGVDVAADTGRRPACVGRGDAADRRVAAAATRAEPVRASRPVSSGRMWSTRRRSGCRTTNG